ncbi:MAG: SDR family NAD(P)-dependent oxidoreductase [Planctomycetota bacterium]|jgi:NAD(P)-dependent dehydrogenase (short-subunit alcohol dehydrogenase family)|nr:SDR family NAD(P)-dependent oxidoreductase [Planctomycetota bacterium]
MIDLRGKTALVTGSTQGVGSQIAIALAQAGAKVLVHGLHEDDHAQGTLERCRSFCPESKLVCFDLLAPIPVILDRLVAPLLGEHPELSIVVSNAGVYIDPPFLEVSEANFDHTMHLNVKVGFFLAQAFAKHCVARQIDGRLLFTGSINGLLAEVDHSVYDTSKGALAAMVRSLCVALAPLRIRVNAIAPGLVRTPLTNQILSSDPASLEWMALHTPNGQVPEAQVCGPLAAFLVSDLAEHIHGQTIYVDGGMSAWQQPDVPPEYRAWRNQRSGE